MRTAILLISQAHRAMDDLGSASAALEPLLAENRLLKLDNTQIPFQAWWQVGQVLEKDKNVASLTVEVYEKGLQVAEGNNQMREYQYSMNPRLADAYVTAGMKDKARAKLLEGYANTDHSEESTHNPGYGDYQDLSEYLAIAQKLVACGCRLEAIPIYADGLSEPERFERAKTWGGSARYAEQFKEGLSNTILSLKDEDYAQFLRLPPIKDTSPTAENDKGSKPKKDKLETGFALLPLTPTPEIEPNQSSVAAIVTSHLSKSKEGLQLMADFDAKLASRLEQTPGEVALMAMRALIAASSTSKPESSTAPEHFQRLTELVPQVDPEAKTVRPDADAFALYSPALVGLTAEDPAIKSAAGKLADRLIALANASERKAISEALVLAKIRHAAGDASSEESKFAMLNAMLDQAVKATTPPRVLSTDAAENCIRIAEAAVVAEAWPIVIDALGRALGGGPPLRKMGGDTGATFMLQASRNTFNRDTKDYGLEAMTKRVHQVLADVTPKFAEDSELAEHAYQTLAWIVMPAQRTQEIFPYATDFIRPNVSNPFNRAEVEPTLGSPSVAQSLVEAAKACGKVAELKSRLAKRRTQVKSKTMVDWVAFQVAWADRDSDDSYSEKAFIDMATSMGVLFNKDGDNPKDDGATDRKKEGDESIQLPASEVSVKTSLDNQSSANLLLHASYAMYNHKGMTPGVQSVWRHLLKLCASDSELAQASENWRWMIVQIIEDAGMNDAAVADFAELYKGCVEQQYSRYNDGGLIAQRTASAMSGLVNSALRRGRLMLAAKWSRPMLVETRRQGPSATRIGDLCRESLRG